MKFFKSMFSAFFAVLSIGAVALSNIDLIGNLMPQVPTVTIDFNDTATPEEINAHEIKQQLIRDNILANSFNDF